MFNQLNIFGNILLFVTPNCFFWKCKWLMLLLSCEMPIEKYLLSILDLLLHSSHAADSFNCVHNFVQQNQNYSTHIHRKPPPSPSVYLLSLYSTYAQFLLYVRVVFVSLISENCIIPPSLLFFFFLKLAVVAFRVFPYFFSKAFKTSGTRTFYNKILSNKHTI